MQTRRSVVIWGCILFFLFILPAHAADAPARVRLPPQSARPGQTVRIPLMFANLPNLAGLKLILEFDAHRLQYRGIHTSQKADGLMHMVNDTEPGKVILVMAGAKGISLDNEPLAVLRFSVPEKAETGDVNVRIAHIEVMTDTLDTVNVRTENGRIRIRRGVDDPDGKLSGSLPVRNGTCP